MFNKYVSLLNKLNLKIFKIWWIILKYLIYILIKVMLIYINIC